MTDTPIPSADERLFGIPGAEDMHFDLASAYEAQVDAWFDEPRAEDDPWKIEEWTVRPPSSNLPNLDYFIEDLAERAADDSGEGAYDAWLNAADDAVKSAFRVALDLWASKVGYRTGDELVRTYTITWRGPDNEPLADGEPIYGGAR